MKITGHKTDSVFRRYAISDEVALQEQTAKLAGLSALATGTEGKVGIRDKSETVIPPKSRQR